MPARLRRLVAAFGVLAFLAFWVWGLIALRGLLPASAWIDFLFFAVGGTAWGLLNSVTEYVDHHRRARSEDHRREAAWFGQGAQFKQRAWDELIQLTA